MSYVTATVDVEVEIDLDDYEDEVMSYVKKKGLTYEPDETELYRHYKDVFQLQGAQGLKDLISEKMYRLHGIRLEL